MTQAEKDLLLQWIKHVFYMLASAPEVFPAAQREKLADLTANLHEALKRDPGK